MLVPMEEKDYAERTSMKMLILSVLGGAALACLPGCQTSDQASPSGSDTAAVGQKCSQCDCKAYSPGRLIKGVCKDCGHTAAEHSGAAK